MNEAFTVRVRSTGGRLALWVAPAGGMGLSSPCCTAGHDTRAEAFDHGATLLRARLLSPAQAPCPHPRAAAS